MHMHTLPTHTQIHMQPSSTAGFPYIQAGTHWARDLPFRFGGRALNSCASSVVCFPVKYFSMIQISLLQSILLSLQLVPVMITSLIQLLNLFISTSRKRVLLTHIPS